MFAGESNLPSEVEDVLTRASEAYVQNISLRALIQLIPHIGGALDVMLSSKSIEYQRTRLEEFMRQTKEALERLDGEKIDKDFLESEEFEHLFIAAVNAVIRSYEREKITLFRNIFVNSILLGNSEEYYKEKHLDVIADLSATHIEILKRIYERAQYFTEEDKEAARDYVSVKQLHEVFQGLSESQIEALCLDLMRYGLLYDWFAGRLDYKRGYYELTDYARDFIRFIHDPTSII